MALSEGAARVAEMSATDLYKSVHGSKGFEDLEVHNVGGVTLNVRKGLGDELAGDKIGGVRLAVHKVAETGIPMPNDITIYTSSDKSFVNVAFQRAIGGAQQASIGLGGKLGTPMELPIGIATMKGMGSTISYCAAVCVHEIGHILHEMANPEFFWGQEANAATPPALGGRVSMYAGNNIKEFVAETFTGIVYGMKNDFGDAVIQAYRDYHGPTSATFP